MSSAGKDQGRELAAQDELLARYRQASALDDARPGPKLRAAVLAHARAVSAAKGVVGAQASEVKTLADAAQQREASNSPSWRMQALGSLAVIGLVSMLYMQFDRGSQEEREAALGAGSRSPAAPPAVLASPAARADVAPEAKPSAPAVAVAVKRTPAQSQGQGQAQPQAQVRDAAEPAAELAKASAAQQAGADAAPAPGPAAPAPVVAPAPAPTPAPTPARARARAAAPATAAAADASGSSALAARRESSDAATPAQALRQAALAGDLARIEALLAQGAPLESVDEAGRTPLLLAVMQGQRAAVARLLAAGANAQAQDREGATALRHAQSRALTEIESLLRQYGAR